MGHGASTRSSISIINPISIIANDNDTVDIVEHTSFRERSEWRRSRRITRKPNKGVTEDDELNDLNESEDVTDIDKRGEILRRNSSLKQHDKPSPVRPAHPTVMFNNTENSAEANSSPQKLTTNSEKTLTRSQSETKANIKRHNTMRIWRRQKLREQDNNSLLDQYLSDSDMENNDTESPLNSGGCEVLPLSDDYFYGNTDNKECGKLKLGELLKPRFIRSLKRRPSRKVLPNWQPALGSSRLAHASSPSQFGSLQRSQSLIDSRVDGMERHTIDCAGTGSSQVTPRRDTQTTDISHMGRCSGVQTDRSHKAVNRDAGDVQCTERQASTTSLGEKQKAIMAVKADIHAHRAKADIHTNGTMTQQFSRHKSTDESREQGFNSFLECDALCSMLCDGGTESIAQVDPSYLLLVDTRRKRDYKSSHIHRAVMLDVDDLESNNQLELDLCYKNIILYDRNGKSHFKSDSMLTRVYQIFWSAGHRPCLLLGGYAAFSRKYPYLCQLTEMSQSVLCLPLYPTSIIDNKLYIGNCRQGMEDNILDKVGINFVLNLGKSNMATKDEEIDVKNLAIDEKSKISLYENTQEVVSLLHTVLHNRGSSILLCCETGTKISACVAILALMNELKWSAVQCYSLVREKRSAIDIDKHLWKQLLKAEKILVKFSQ